MSRRRLVSSVPGARALHPAVAICLAGGCALLLTFAPPSASARSGCGLNRRRAVQAALAGADSWGKLHRFYIGSRGCDDGGLSEDVTESAMRLLADKWTTLSALATEAAADRKFADFVVIHIDSTANTDDLQAVRRHATRQCLPGDKALCGRLSAAAVRALKE